jgi:hypothetical protein
MASKIEAETQLALNEFTDELKGLASGRKFLHFFKFEPSYSVLEPHFAFLILEEFPIKGSWLKRTFGTPDTKRIFAVEYSGNKYLKFGFRNTMLSAFYDPDLRGKMAGPLKKLMGKLQQIFKEVKVAEVGDQNSTAAKLIAPSSHFGIW